MHRNIARSLSIRRVAQNQKNGPEGHSRGYFFGQADANWLAIVDYFATVHGNEHCQKLDGLIQAVQSCGFVGLMPEKIIFSNRPEVAKFDDQGRLHCEDGPAFICRQGWRWFYLAGVPIFEKYIKTPADDLKLAEILAEPNAEIRTAVLRKFGFQRLLATTHHRIISEAAGNALIEFKLKIGEHHNEYLRTLRLTWQDKTGAKETLLPVPRLARQFGEDCPDNINDCEQVRRWTLGWPKEALALAET